MAALQLRELRVKDLKNAHYNPPGRIHKDRIRDLVNSIGAIGLMQPILVTTKNIIIDGHRRVAAHKELGIETILAIVGNGDPNEIYANLSYTSRKIGGNESLAVYYREPTAVQPMLKARFDNMIAVIGNARLQRILKEGLSISVYNRARQICMYCDQDLDKVPMILDWLMTVQPSQTIKEAITQNVSGSIIMKAVRANKKIKMKAVIDI